jgi:alpha-D-xyloside xylohydrolase
VLVELFREDNQIVLQTSAIRVVLIREPWQMLVYNRTGRLIWATRPVDIEPLRRPEHQWGPAQERWLFMHRYAYPLGVRRGDHLESFASFDLHYDEHIFGLGEDFGRLDKRNTQRRLWLQEGFGNASPAAYKQTPFYMSSRGYGLFINTSNAVRLNIGDLEHTALSILVEDTNLLDFFLIYGPTFKDILPRYTAITGAPAVPPPWSFGLWMGRITYNSQAQVERVAEELRAHRIPCDVIHLDTGWYEEEWVCDLEFSHQRFPDPRAMLIRLRQMGFRVSVWQLPYLVIECALFKEAAAKGYLARRPYGRAYLFSGFLSDAGLLDYSNPEAVAWIQEKFTGLFQLGVAAIKADFGEGAPPEAIYQGVPGESMHNLYPLLYNKAVFEVTEAFFGKGQAVIWARSAWAGSQRYPVHWSGDGIARYEDLACVLRSALSFGLSGFPFYSHDVGGFSGLPSPDLYARWIQLGVFTSHVRCHGQPPREPWEYGEQAEAIFRQYVELRYRLLPYIYGEAMACGRTSLPMLRALALDFQDDPTALSIEDQYLFGWSFLVAPILDETGQRNVYLPAGDWIDFWDKSLRHGPCWLDVIAPLEILPLYVRAGAIIPYGPAMQYVGEMPCDPLTLEIYLPQEAGQFTIMDLEVGEISVRYQRIDHRLVIDTGRAPGEIEIILFGVAVRTAMLEGQQLQVGSVSTGGYSLRFNGQVDRQLILELDES